MKRGIAAAKRVETIRRRTGRALLGCITAMLWPALCLAAGDETAIKAQHGDWQIVCKTPEGAKAEICALVQDVTSESNPNIGLSVQFQRAADASTVLRVFAPLGILLPPGLGLKIDDKDVGNAPFLRCHSFACYAQVVAEDKLVETAIFIIFQTEEAGIGIPISLKGFGDALAKLN